MASPLRSPFKSIANCVAQVLTWPSLDAGGKSPKKERSKSRSISPEIPKMEEPKQYTLSELNENSQPSPVRRSSRAKPKIEDEEEASKTTSRRSSRIKSNPATPQVATPTSKRRSSRPQTPMEVTREETSSRRSSRVRKTPLHLRDESPLQSLTKSRDSDQGSGSEDSHNDEEEIKVASKKSTRQRSDLNLPEVDTVTTKRKSLRTQTPKEARSKPQTPKQDETSSRRSSRVRRTPLSVKDGSPKTPPSNSDDEDFKPEKYHSPRSRTPGTSRTPRRALAFCKDEEINSKLMKTPKRKQMDSASAQRDTPAKRRKTMTPRIPARSVPLAKDKSSLEEAQLRLHVGAVPDSLPCREDEFAQILSFTEGKIFDGTGGCMYISGVPGTGKTATVKEVIRTLQRSCDDGELPNFQFIEINGMRLTEPNQLYAQLWKSLSGAKVTTEHAKNLLEKRFTTPSSGKKNQTTVVLVDELDLLWNRKQSVLYNIFEWPNSVHSKLVILAIANTMDLPERVMINRVASRIGLTRLTFSPYTHVQLQEIVTCRLTGLTVFDKDAIQLVSRKVASLSGDARRALDICRRATEIAQRLKEKDVSIQHVTAAHKEMFCSPKILAIRCCSKYEKIFLQAIVAVFQKIGIEEAPFERVVKAMNEVLKFEGLHVLEVGEAHNILGRLSAIKLVLVEPGKIGRLDMKLRLNVSQDDVLFALRDSDSNSK